ncbi:MAG: YciI family protein [bacterium]
MQYLLMCYFNEERWAKTPGSQRDEVIHEYGKVVQSIVKSGHYRAGAKLQLSSAATTVREKNGKRVITDGPFAETKEQLGGYHLVECKDLDEAIAIAMRIPTIRVGGSIEVRPLIPESEGESR